MWKIISSELELLSLWYILYSSLTLPEDFINVPYRASLESPLPTLATCPTCSLCSNSVRQKYLQHRQTDRQRPTTCSKLTIHCLRWHSLSLARFSFSLLHLQCVAATSCRSLRSCCGSCCRFCCGRFAVEVDMPLEPRQMAVPPRLPLFASLGCHKNLLLPFPFSFYYEFSDWTVCLFFTTSQYGYCYCHWRIACLQFGHLAKRQLQLQLQLATCAQLWQEPQHHNMLPGS